MVHSHTRLILSLLVVLMLGALVAAHADIVIYTGGTDLPEAAKLPDATAGDIRVNDTFVLKLPGGGGGVPLDVRAEIMDTRITEILSAGIVGPVVIGDVHGKPTIWVGPYRLITVYPEDATTEGTTMKSLADTWAMSVQAMLWKCSPAVGPSAEEMAVHAAAPAP
jgi:hypothetical protein